jgi:hypothetical protein
VLIRNSIELARLHYDLDLIKAELSQPTTDTIAIVTFAHIHAAKVFRREVPRIKHLRLLTRRQAGVPMARSPDAPTRSPVND